MAAKRDTKAKPAKKGKKSAPKVVVPEPEVEEVLEDTPADVCEEAVAVSETEVEASEEVVEEVIEEVVEVAVDSEEVYSSVEWSPEEIPYSEPVVIPDVSPEPPVEAEPFPLAVPVLSDAEQKVAVTATVNAVIRIGGCRYILEKGEDVRGGVLLAHLGILQGAGKVKRKA